MAIVIAGAASIGWIQLYRETEKVTAKDQEIALLTNQNLMLLDKAESAERENQRLAGKLRESTRDVRTVQAKAEFLDRHLSYATAPGDSSRNALISYTCALWVNWQNYNVQLAQVNRPIVIDERRTASALKTKITDQVTPKSSTKAAQSVPRSILHRIASDQAKLWLSNEPRQVVKAVDFGDGRPRILPAEIAEAIHKDPNCQPR
jgi:hypothetical protein